MSTDTAPPSVPSAAEIAARRVDVVLVTHIDVDEGAGAAMVQRLHRASAVAPARHFHVEGSRSGSRFTLTIRGDARAILALVGSAIAAVAGSAPSPGLLAAVVIGVGLAFALTARFLIRRIPWFGVALYVARRASARRPGRRRPEGP